MNSKWKFSEIDRMEELSFNSILEEFSAAGVDTLVKENLQNSLDARLDNNIPVKVVIEIGNMSANNIPGINEIRERIQQLKGQNTYSKETIKTMQQMMGKDIVQYISFEDSNTKGLKYIKNSLLDKQNTWSVYAYHKGFHAEEADQEKEQSRGGSHGIGKIASNAASHLHMMYFSNCDENGSQHIGGTVQLIEHQYQNKFYRATGYFTDEYVDCKTQRLEFTPYKNIFDRVFIKNTRGLKLVIPFLKEDFNNERDIIRCICDNFFLAILQNKLTVEINHKQIDAHTIGSFINSTNYYEQEVSMIKKDFTPLYYRSYTVEEPRELRILDKSNKEHLYQIYFQYDPNIVKGRAAIVRTIGMKIEDFKVTGGATKPYNAVIIPMSSEEDMFLKSLENESHTKLSVSHLKDKTLKANATRFLKNLTAEITKIIDEFIRKNNQTDGLMNTKDIIYDVEAQFKKELEKVTSTVKIVNGKKEILQVGRKPKKKGTGSHPQGGGQGQQRKKSKTKKAANKPGNNEEDTALFHAHPSEVERVIYGQKELVQFNFSSNDELNKIEQCNISIAVVDGMGNILENEFTVADSYKKVTDELTGLPLTIDENRIMNVKVNEGKIKLTFELASHYNKSLKFVYLVEA